MLLSVLSVTAGADTATYSGTCGAEGDNVTWEIDVNTGTLYINGTGDMADYNVPESTPWYEYREFPGFSYIVVGEGVTSIGDNAFIITNATKITLSSTVKELGVGCLRLTADIFIDEENPYLKMDEYGVIYSKDGKTLVYASKYIYNRYTVPEGVEEFAPDAFCQFSNYWSLDEVPWLDIPASVKKIPINAFHLVPFSGRPRFSVNENNPYYSSDEYGVLFDKNKEILYISPFCFSAYSMEYTNYVIPETVKEIADYAFYGITKESILITKNVTKIGSFAFWPSLEIFETGYVCRLYIPKTVTSLADYFFVDKDFLEEYSGENQAIVYFEGSQAEWEALYKGNKDWFTVYYEHEHTNTIVEETCTQKIYTCSGCKTTNFIEDIGDNHDWREHYREQKFPCQGELVYYNCDNCEANKIEKGTPTEEHDWSNISTPDYPYCEGGTFWFSCICGAEKIEYIEPLGHDYRFVSDNNATCTEDGTKHEVCSRCDDIGETVVDVGSKLGHDLTETTVLSQQSCTQDGISVQACKRCAEIVATIEGAYGHFDNDGDGKCDECRVVLEVILPEVPSEPETDVTPEEPESPEEPQENTDILSKLIELFNKILNILKKLFGI